MKTVELNETPGRKPMIHIARMILNFSEDDEHGRDRQAVDQHYASESGARAECHRILSEFIANDDVEVLSEDTVRTKHDNCMITVLYCWSTLND